MILLISMINMICKPAPLNHSNHLITNTTVQTIYNIIKARGDEIKVESKEEEGSAFILSITVIRCQTLRSVRHLYCMEVK
jgi:hypothetical protein